MAHWIPVLVIASVLITAPGCSQSATQAVEGGPTEDGAAPAGPPPALIRVAEIQREQVAPEFRALGNVRPRHFSIVASGAEGVVEEFPIEVGDFVSAGTLLSKLRMESTDLDIAEQEAILNERKAELEEVRFPRKEDEDEARARKQAADVTHANATRRLEELRALSIRGAANPTEVKDAQDNLDRAEQDRLAAVAVLARVSNPRPEAVQQAAARLEAQEKHVEFLKAEREKRMTKAPFEGFVVEEHTYVGQWLSKGAPVATLAKLDEVEVEVQIDQQYIDQISPGRKVTLNIQGSGNRNGLARAWPGEVAAIVPRSNWENGSRSFPVIIRIQNEMDNSTMPPVPAVREGMMAEAEFKGENVDGILVPKDSMVRTSRGTFIYVVNPQKEGQPLSVRQVLIETGVSTGTSIQVTGQGIEAGQLVVTEGAERLRAFQTVQIMNDDSAGKSDDSDKSR